MTSDTTIDYDSLQSEALRGLVKAVLIRVAKSGLPGDHHLYISFDVKAAGVILSKRLREKYPTEMTIVLQHRFWDLIVNDERFEVKLTFDGIPERLVVPFAAIKVFLDPSVRYVLHFEEASVPKSDPAVVPDHEGAPGQNSTGQLMIGPKKTRPQRPKLRSERDVGRDQSSAAFPASPVGKLPAPLTDVSTKTSAPAASPASTTTGNQSTAPQAPPVERLEPAASAQVVSLDAFRKK